MGRMNKPIFLQGIGSTGFYNELATQICTLNSNLSYDTTTGTGVYSYYTLKWYGKPLLQWEYYPDDSKDTRNYIDLYQIVGKTRTEIGTARYAKSVNAGGTYTRTLYMIGMATNNFLYLSFNPWDGSFTEPVIFFAAKVADTSADDGYRILSSAINHYSGTSTENPGSPQAISKYLTDATTGATGYSIVHRLPYERTDTQTEIIPSKIITWGSNSTVAYNLTNIIDTTKLGMNSTYNIDGKIYYTVSPHTAILYNEK